MLTIVSPITTIIRRPRSDERVLYMIGPGGVGKSTLGKELAISLGFALIDLDQEFCQRIANIGLFIRAQGYVRYKTENSALAHALIFPLTEPTIVVTSSGFLSSDNPYDVGQANLSLVRTGYSLTLLPSNEIEQATPIVVERQMRRGFELDRQREEKTFRERFELYKRLGDMVIISSSTAEETASVVATALVTEPGLDKPVLL